MGKIIKALLKYSYVIEGEDVNQSPVWRARTIKVVPWATASPFYALPCHLLDTSMSAPLSATGALPTCANASRISSNVPSLTAFAPQLRAWLGDWEKGRAQEFTQAQNDAYENRVTLYLEVERMLTPQQREHALHKL
jgi:hypothetical protein